MCSEGVGANLFLPLALAMFCVGCLNCAEAIFTYYLRNIQERLSYQGTPMEPQLDAAPPQPSTQLMSVGQEGRRLCSLGSYGSVGNGLNNTTEVRAEQSSSPPHLPPV